MKENQAFTYFGVIPNFDVLLHKVLSIEESQWTLFKERKSGVAAEKTDTIPLVYDTKTRLSSYVAHELYEQYKDNIDDAIQLCDVGTRVEQAMFARLGQGVEIGRHKDKGVITAATHRIHVPIITNDKCVFTVDTQSMVLPAGEVWIIDNVDKYHSVSNKGSNSRIHLIIDVR
jgi:aspartyl/asparaginyl beta-hydroxylase (cupin superfamily)